MQDADLHAQMNQSMADVARIQPLTNSIEEVLRVFYNFETPKVHIPIVDNFVDCQTQEMT